MYLFIYKHMYIYLVIYEIYNFSSKLKYLSYLRDQFEDSLPGPTFPRFTKACTHWQLYRRDFQSFI